MPEEPTSTLNHGSELDKKRSRALGTRTTSTVAQVKSVRIARLGHLLTGIGALVAAAVSGSNIGLGQLWESQARSLFFELRGRVQPPDDIVILAIDEQSISMPSEYYEDNPKKYADLKPLKAYPYRREAYAEVIKRVMGAGAKAVAVDVLFTTPSSYGPEDDKILQQALQKYAGKVTLAAEIYEEETPEGMVAKQSLPDAAVQTKPMSIGLIKFPVELDNKIHRFGGEFTRILAEKYSRELEHLEFLKTPLPSLAEATLQAANVKNSPRQDDYINFYGPAETFKHIPFWHVLDPQSWNTRLLQGQIFKDKIVLIGGTAKSLQDFHAAPFSKTSLYPDPMAGVEIHANAIASLMTRQAKREAITTAPLRGLFILLLVGGAAFAITRTKRGLHRFIGAIAIATAWGGISYITFTFGQMVLPTGVPIIAIIFGGVSYLATGAAKEGINRKQLRDFLKDRIHSPMAQELISQQEDLQDLVHLQRREQAISGKTLCRRYQIVKVLGAGGFSETYIAKDTQLPGDPLCVVKQLKPANSKPKQMEVARRLFREEAQTLQKLGTYPQIPQLLAYFEEDQEFYLLQELIVGHPLSQELAPGNQLLETEVIKILRDLLPTLAFVHSNKVIHRDIKPSNIIRRHQDNKLVLIDFGAVKEVNTQVLMHEGQTSYTIGIGTQGYAPDEQCKGHPKYSSDIYAVGMIGIKALTGKAPHELELDTSGEWKWTQYCPHVSSRLAAILSKMVKFEHTARYQSATEVLEALNALAGVEQISFSSSSNGHTYADDTVPLNDLNEPTTPWSSTSEEITDSSSSTSM